MKTLVPHPPRAPIVQMIFEGYVVHGLGFTQIQDKLNADPELVVPGEAGGVPFVVHPRGFSKQG